MIFEGNLGLFFFDLVCVDYFFLYNFLLFILNIDVIVLYLFLKNVVIKKDEKNYDNFVKK